MFSVSLCILGQYRFLVARRRCEWWPECGGFLVGRVLTSARLPSTESVALIPSPCSESVGSVALGVPGPGLCVAGVSGTGLLALALGSLVSSVSASQAVTSASRLGCSD